MKNLKKRNSLEQTTCIFWGGGLQCEEGGKAAYGQYFLGKGLVSEKEGAAAK